MWEIFKKTKGNKKYRLLTFGFLLLFFSITFFGFVHTASAQAELLSTVFPQLLATAASTPMMLVNYLFEGAASFLMAITSLLMWAGGGLLDISIKYSILDIRSYINSPGVVIAWQTFRDLANMAFIFILLYVAIGTILGIGGINMKKILTRVILVALLLNFSFFFTKVAVDTSNIVSVAFYNEIISTPCASGSAPAAPSISSAVMCRLGMTSFYGNDVLHNLIKNRPSEFLGWKLLVFGVMAAVLMLIVAVIFTAAAIMFIARLAGLIFLFILSPLAITAMALPSDHYSGRWTKSLLDKCLFPPAFMALMWAALQVLNKLTISPDTNKLADIFLPTDSGGPVAGSGDILISFAIVIALMIGTLIIAKEFGAYGADGALGILGRTKNRFQGFVGRNTIGRGAYYLDKKIANKVPGGDSRLGRFAREFTTGALVETTFGGELSRKEDVERIKKEKASIASESRKRQDKQILKDAAKPGATSAEKEEAFRAISRMSTKEIDSLEAKEIENHIDKFNPAQLEHLLEKSEKFNDAQKEQFRNLRFEPLKAAIKTATNPASTPTDVDTAKAKIKEIVKSSSDKEIELMDPAVSGNPLVISSMKDAQIESYNKSSRYSAAQKKNLKTVLEKPLKDAIAARDATTIQTLVNQMKPQKVAKLDKSELTDILVMDVLTPAILNEIPKEHDIATLRTIGAHIRSVHPVGHPTRDYIETGRGRGIY